MTKITTAFLLGSLLLAGGNCIAARHSSAPRPSLPLERLQAGGEITVGGKTFKVGLPENLKKNHKRRVVDSDITEQPQGTPQEYSKASGGYYFYGSYTPYMDYGQAATIYWDGNDAYIYNILSYKETDTYVRGTREGDVLTVPLNQMVAFTQDFAIRIGLLRTEIVVAPNPDWEDDDPEDMKEITYINFVYSEDYDKVTYSIGEDGSLSLVIPELPEGTEIPDDGYTHLDPADYGFPDYALGFYYTDDLTWTGDGDIYQDYTEFNYTLVEEPVGATYNYFSYVNHYDMGVLVYVARLGDKLFIKGLSAYAPNAVFEANLVQTDKGLVASVPQLQFVGSTEDGYYNLLTRTKVYDPKIRDYTLASPEVDAEFTVKTDDNGNIVSMTGSNDKVLVFNYADDEYDPYDEFPGVTLRYQESLEGTPVAPTGAYFEDHSAWLGANYLFFYFTQFSEEGNILDVDQLFYRVFVNGEPYEFVQHDGNNLKGEFTTMYQGVKTPTTLVPFTFYNGLDLWSDEYHLFYVGFYQTDIESIGVQTIYTYGDEPTYSDIVTIDVAGVKDIQDAEAVATEYFDLSGVKVARPDKGIFIKRTVMSDGSVRISKEVK